MLNILTSEYKKTLRSEYLYRKVVVFLWLVFVLASTSFLLGFSLYIISNFRALTLASSDEKALSKTELIEYENLKASLAKINESSLSLSSPGAVLFSDILEKITKARPQGIKVNSLSIDYLSGKKTLTGNLSGLLLERQQLIDFVDALKKDPIFAKVDYPVSNLIGVNDSHFNISLEIANKQNDKK